MKIYIFSDHQNLGRLVIDEKEIRDTLNYVAEGTDTSDLVVALYLVRGIHNNRGTAYVRNWISPIKFFAKKGTWKLTQKWDIPSDLPPKFKLIRMRLHGNNHKYPLNETDLYNWEFIYKTFISHLATLFAHELHHFRRYHLGLHPREGEHSANYWALNHVQNLGFPVEARRHLRKRKIQSLHYSLIKKFPRIDPFAQFRKLSAGARLIVTHDPRKQYLSEIVTVIRPIRSNSKRIVVQTSDGKTWRWPMAWLKNIEEG